MDSKWSIKPLEGKKNWATWKFRVTILLKMHEGAFEVIHKKLIKPTELAAKAEGKVLEEYEAKLSAFTKGENNAMMVLTNSLSEEILRQVMRFNSALEIWLELHRLFDGISEDKAYTLCMEFFGYTAAAGQEMATTISELKTIFTDLQSEITMSAEATKLPDLFLICKILDTLPENYFSFKSSWMLLSKTERTVDNLTTQLCAYERSLAGKDISRVEQEVLLTKTGSKNATDSAHSKGKSRKNYECYYCKVKGHYARNCRKWIADGKPDLPKISKKESKDSNDGKKSGEKMFSTVSSVHVSGDRQLADESWYADNGATSHVTSHREWFVNFKKFDGQNRVSTVFGNSQSALGTGSIEVEVLIDGIWEAATLSNVWYVPGIKSNLFSLLAAQDVIKESKFESTAEECVLKDSSGTPLVIGSRRQKGGLYKLALRVREPTKKRVEVNAISSGNHLQLWHERLGHQNKRHVQTFVEREYGIRLPGDGEFCEGCAYGKSHRLKFGDRTAYRATQPGQLIHADVCGPFKESIGGSKYFVLFKDDYSRYRSVYFMKNKSEVSANLQQFIKEAKTAGHTVKEFRCDGGGEFDNSEVRHILSQSGIQQRITMPYTPEQNGCAERENRTIVESARSMLYAHGTLPQGLWAEMVNTAGYVLNRTAKSAVTNKTPFELWFGRKPSTKHLRVIGTVCFAHIPKERRRKMDKKATRCILIGYDADDGYRLWSNKLIRSRDVLFQEEVIIEEPVSFVPTTKSVREVEGTIAEGSDDEDLESGEEQSRELPEPIESGRQLRNRSKLQPPGWLKEDYVMAVFPEVQEPETFEEAVNSSNRAHWEAAMDSEHSSLLENSTWTLMKLPKGRKAIKTKKYGISVVELKKVEGSTLGIIIAGGIDKGCYPKIINLRSGSIASRSDQLDVGDKVISVNGICTTKLKHQELVNLLTNAQQKVILEVEYELPYYIDDASCVSSKLIQVKLEKEIDSFGFTIRGGSHNDPIKSRPLIITHIRPGGPADRDGTIKIGDRLVTVNNINLSRATLSEALSILKQVSGEAVFIIEYDVSIVDLVQVASGPLLVELEKHPCAPLGITLTSSPTTKSAIIIESIKQASLAERCGALHVNDQLLVINDIRTDQMTPVEAMQLLRTTPSDHLRLEILPLSQVYLKRRQDTSMKKGHLSPTPSQNPSSSGGGFSGYNTFASYRGYNSSRIGPNRIPKSILPGLSSVSLTSNVTTMATCSQVCHPDTTEVTLQADLHGYGLALQVDSNNPNDLMAMPPVVGNLDPGGPAEKSGVIQVGDRIIAVNGRSTEHLSLEEVTQMIIESKPQVNLGIEFDVAESVISSSGTFTVKLAKRGAGLGITITSPKHRRPSDPLIISDVRKGSVAHRTGTIFPGDSLIAINTVRMENCTIEDAAHLLQSCEDIVKLRIQKDESFSDDIDLEGVVVYAVELIRHGGPLGLTISGTEDPFDPIVISGLTPGGLAEKTGALHVGDRLLAINNQSLRGKTLSEAILLLQNSSDVVSMKISRNAMTKIVSEKTCEPEKETYLLAKHNTPLPSIDSAVESWDSAGLDIINGRNGNERFSKPECQNAPKKLLGNGSYDTCPEVTDDGISDTDWDNHTHSSRGSETCAVNDTTSEDKEWAKILDDFEQCSRQLSQLGISASSSKTPEVPEALPSELKLKSNELADGLAKFTSENHHCLGSNLSPFPVELHRVTLFKDKCYEDFGFSVSDGLYDRGVYINRIRPGGPADLCGILQPCDRILQVNNTRTHNYDCCLTVPLIAAAGDKIDLIVARNPYASHLKLHGSNSGLPWIEDEDQRDFSASLQTQSIPTSTL